MLTLDAAHAAARGDASPPPGDAVTTLRTDLRDPAAPAPRAQWSILWGADGAPNAGAWEGLAGPPGVAAGDSYPTRPGDRSHPAAPPVVDLDGSAPVIALASPDVMRAELARGLSSLVRRWFEPGR